MADWFRDGTRVEHIPINDRGFQYGDGLFETVAIRGGEARLWPLHMRRLRRGCEALNISVPPQEELGKRLVQAIRLSGVRSERCIAKIIVTAGSGERGYGRAQATPAIWIGVFEAQQSKATMYRDGIVATLCATRLAAPSPTAGLKTLSRTEQVLARSEIDTFEGLMMDADDRLICGTMSNVFFVSNKSISTPAIDRCGVAGVMRRHVMTCLKAEGLQVTVEDTRRSDLKHVDEVFISNSQIGVVPVTACDDMHWDIGAITRRVMAIMTDNEIDECRA